MKKDAYPLPRTDACLDAMSGATWFSTFDLRSSYHQVGVDERDMDKTAFICREGQFRFRTMPFGLCNAGATFQRLMDVVMSGLTYEVCLTYLDDVIVFASSLEEHSARLRLVFDRLQSAGLKLKPSKCSLLQRTVEFLGHVVSEGRVGVNPAKVRDVVEWPTPTSLKEVRGFVGLCSYYRRFVKGFGEIAAPLNALSEKNKVFCWTAECDAAFQTLKEILTTAPLLAMPNETDMFILDADASLYSIGGVLSQVQDGVERPVAYASRKLSRAETNYCVTRRELLAVVNFLKYFHHHLMGRRFQVRTDHAALQWLRRIPEPVGQQAWWIGYMEEFDFEIVHRAGKSHGNAYAMSRRPCRQKECLCGGGDTDEPGGIGAGGGDVGAVRPTINILNADAAVNCSTCVYQPRLEGSEVVDEVSPALAEGEMQRRSWVRSYRRSVPPERAKPSTKARNGSGSVSTARQQNNQRVAAVSGAGSDDRQGFDNGDEALVRGGGDVRAVTQMFQVPVLIPAVSCSTIVNHHQRADVGVEVYSGVVEGERLTGDGDVRTATQMFQVPVLIPAVSCATTVGHHNRVDVGGLACRAESVGEVAEWQDSPVLVTEETTSRTRVPEDIGDGWSARQQNDQGIAAVRGVNVVECCGTNVAGVDVGVPEDVEGMQIVTRRIVPKGVAVNDADAGNRRGGERIARQRNGLGAAAVNDTDDNEREVLEDESEGWDTVEDHVDDADSDADDE